MQHHFSYHTVPLDGDVCLQVEGLQTLRSRKNLLEYMVTNLAVGYNMFIRGLPEQDFRFKWIGIQN